MKFLTHRKDGGPESRSFGFFVVEIKKLFSVVFLRFEDGSRDAFHTHAFNAISWVLKGKLVEHHMDGTVVEYLPSWKPIFTNRETFHKVSSVGRTSALTLRGPWMKFWKEYLPLEKKFLILTNRRLVVAEKN